MASSRIVELASLITSNTAILDAYLTTTGLPKPSFDAHYLDPVLSDESASAARQAVIELTDELHALLLGPVGALTSPSHNFLISLHAIQRFGLATAFPLGRDEATFEELASASGLDVSLTRRLLRHAMTYRIFHEPQKGTVAHTAASSRLARDPLIRQWVGMVSEEMWPSASKTVEALARWPGSEEPNHAGFNIAHTTDETLFGELNKHPPRRARYADVMAWFGTGPDLDTSHIIESYNWAEIGTGTIVDVGGSHGLISIEIARRYPSLHCIVQDQSETVTTGEKNLPASLKGRVEFAKHNFFTEQPVRGASVYLLRWVLHDWPDAYAVQILRALIPAVQDGSAILICEQILPGPGAISIYQERSLRSFDLAMLEFHNAKERDLGDWIALLEKADPRFNLVAVRKPRGSRLAALEIKWCEHNSSVR